MKKNIPFKIKHSSQKIVSSGGFVFVDRLLDQHGISQEIDNELPKHVTQQQYPYSDLMRSLLITRLAGGESLEDVNYFRQELQEIRRAKVPSADTIARSLKKLSVENHIFCDTKKDTVVETNYHARLNNLLFSIAARSLPSKYGGYTLDMDAHYVPCEKEDANYDYKKNKSYSLMAASIGTHFVDVKVRNGNVSPKRGQQECLERVLKRCKEANINISAVRIDNAGYIFEMLDALDRKSIRYYVRAKMNPKLQKIAAGKPREYWQKAKNGLEWLEMQHEGRRYIMQRRITKQRQINMFTQTEYRYLGIITNDRRKKATGAYIIDFYNHRASSERNFEYLNQDFASHQMPFAKMNHNATYLTTTALLHNIFEWVKNELYGLVPWLGSVNMRAKRFRFRFAMVAARWRKRARTHILELFHPQNSYEMLAPS